MLHGAAFAAVMATMRQHGLVKGEVLANVAALGDVFELFTKNARRLQEVDFETLALAANTVREQQSLRALLSIETGAANVSARKVHYLVFTFPDRYVQSVVENLVHPAWRAACFSATCTNASNWAAYGDQHRGAALVLRPQTDGDHGFLPLMGVIGVSAVVGRQPQPVRGAIRGELCRVHYTNRAPEVEFFRSLGTIPMKKLDRAWRVNRAGERSKLIDEIMTGDASWRAAYWASFQRVATTKLDDWKHEEEYRIVLPDMLGLRTDTAGALVKYDFSSLVGLIFGIRTSETDKVAIITQIVSQCEQTKRTDFLFYQVTYDGAKGCLVRL